MDKGLANLYLSFRSEILPPFLRCLWIASLSSSIFLKIDDPLEFDRFDMVAFVCMSEAKLRKFYETLSTANCILPTAYFF